MKNKKNNRSRFVGMRFKPDEFERIEQLSKNTTTPEISSFIRSVLFNKPIAIKQRNQSLDDFMAEMMMLRQELNAIGKNFNQVVKKLHTLSQIAEFQNWIISYEADKKILFNKIEIIQQRINQISDLWLQ